MNIYTSFSRNFFAVLAALSAAFSVFGQVTIVVPYAAGGPSDSLARLVAPAMQLSLKQPVNIMSILGNQGVTGALHVAKAPPDGLTVLYADLAVANALKAANPSVSLLDSFDAIGIIGELPLVLLTSKTGRVTDLNQLRNGGRIGSSETGSISQGCASILQKALPGSIHIPYKGTGPVITAVMNGEVDVACINADRNVHTVRVLAISQPSSNSFLKGIRTFKDQGINIEHKGIIGLFVVKGVAPEKSRALEAAFATAMSDPVLRARLTQDFFLQLD